jgi:hypothetical protein
MRTSQAGRRPGRLRPDCPAADKAGLQIAPMNGVDNCSTDTRRYAIALRD